MCLAKALLEPFDLSVIFEIQDFTAECDQYAQLSFI